MPADSNATCKSSAVLIAPDSMRHCSREAVTVDVASRLRRLLKSADVIWRIYALDYLAAQD